MLTTVREVAVPVSDEEQDDDVISVVDMDKSTGTLAREAAASAGVSKRKATEKRAGHQGKKQRGGHCSVTTVCCMLSCIRCYMISYRLSWDT